jgi:hypothetical protein
MADSVVFTSDLTGATFDCATHTRTEWPDRATGQTISVTEAQATELIAIGLATDAS